MDPIFYVYEHWRPDRNECFYVGKGMGDRATVLYGRNQYHTRIIDKLKRSGLQVEIRIYRHSLTEAEALALEIDRIAQWRAMGVLLTNLTDGGEGVTGMRHTDEAKARIKAASTGRIVSQETRRKQSVTGSRTRQSEEYKKEARKRALEQWRNPEFVEKAKAAHKAAAALKRGVPRGPHSDETRQKIGAAHRARWDKIGRKPPREPKPRIPKERPPKRSREEFIEDARRRGFRDKEAFLLRAHLGPAASAKKVICLTDGKEFESASAAAAFYGVAKSALIELCLGKHGRKSVGGKVFQYKEAA